MSTGGNNRIRFALTSMCLTLVMSTTPGLAGKLDDFETSVASKQPQHDSQTGTGNSNGSHALDTGDCIASFLAPEFFEILGIALLAGGAASFDRVTDGSDQGDNSARTFGEPLIPFISIEPAWQTLKSDVEGFDLQAELGYGPLSLHGRFTQYREETPDARLNLTRVSFLYRMSIGSEFEIDLGIGTFFLDGDTEFSRFSFSMPMRLHPGGPVGLEFRPAWSENLADYDAAVYLTLGNVSLKFGYRWLNAPTESLNGHYIGLSLRL